MGRKVTFGARFFGQRGWLVGGWFVGCLVGGGAN